MSGKDAVLFNGISIHALREEGDLHPVAAALGALRISIHALREEGDGTLVGLVDGNYDFYPRPPRGGRQPAKTAGRRS